MNKLLEDYSKKPIIPIGKVNGATESEYYDYEFSSSDDEDDNGLQTQYEENFVAQEMRKYAHHSGAKQDEGHLFEVEGVDGIEYKNNPLNVYSSYNFGLRAARKELPIDSFKTKILDMLKINNILVIQGPTGCGKTTQVPQYIMDDCKDRRDYCNIVVTQPRRIATITVAKRVCQERGWTLGTICGYQVGLEKKTHPDMILTYVTTGVLLQKLIQAKSLNQYTHIIIDEVHERNQDLDFLLLIVRRFHYTVSPRTKVILMSATIDAEEFAYYFRSHTLENKPLPAPIIQVNKRSNFKNTVFYLESLVTAVFGETCRGITFDIDRPEITLKMWEVFVLLVALIDKLDEIDPSTNEKVIGSILVFLPGINEIEEASRRLEAESQGERSQAACKDGTAKPKWHIVPLHSSLPSDEQALAFLPANEGHRKIILSTNIAESSVTVPDTFFVIDFCQTKVMTVDPITKYMSLKLEWASHVNCDQRAGRVGRVANGRVYRLVTRSFYEDKMSDKSIPEILRAPLERVVLQAKMLNFHDTPQQILALAINPPNLKNIELTILTLKELGGLLSTCRGSSSTYDGDISFLGTIMAHLPVDVRLSKLIVLGHLFCCLKEAIIIAAGCSIQNIFATPFHQRLNAYKKLLVWADGSFSDLIALLNLYQVWQSKKRDNQFSNLRAELQWCSKNLVNFKGLREWQLLVTEITQRLEYLHITHIQGQPHLNDQEKPLILKIVTAGAFYPNFFVKHPDENHMDGREAVKAVGGRNPFRTVFLTGMDPTQPGQIYISHIKDMLKSDREVERNMLIGFDGSTKVYVEFKSYDSRNDPVTVSLNGRQMVTDGVLGGIPNVIYEAIRKRQLRQIFSLKLLPPEMAWSFAESKGIERKTCLQKLEDANLSYTTHDGAQNCFSGETFNPIPSLDTEWISMKLTDFIDAGHFWINTMESERYLAQIEEQLNRVVLHGAIAAGETIKVGKMYVARYVEDNLFYRCQVISAGAQMTHVIFVDYGNTQQVNPADLFLLPDFPEKVAPLGVECILHGIKPSRKTNPKGIWSESVNAYWKNQLFGFLLYGKVHSVVDNVVYLELYKSEKKEKTINQIMIDLGHAEPAAESFLSKADHEKRLQVIKADNPSREAYRLSFDTVHNSYSDVEAPRIDSYVSTKTIELKGPFSPLEMKIHGLLTSAGEKTVEIEGSSVNTVLLDNYPQDYHTRLLVAGCVTQSQLGNKLKIRQTTLMPNIPGLPMLLALLFCPTMMPKVTSDGTRVCSILCGLGYNIYTNKAYYPDHDLNLVLDTHLTEADINNINKIRFAMNQGIKLMHRIHLKMAAAEEMTRTQVALKRELINLFNQTRTPADRVNVKYSTLWYKNNFDAPLLKSLAEEDDEDIWPLLWFVQLNVLEGYDPNTSKNLDDMDLMARNMIPVKDASCLLCKVAFLTVHDVRLHLISELHKSRLKDYNEKITY